MLIRARTIAAVVAGVALLSGVAHAGALTPMPASVTFLRPLWVQKKYPHLPVSTPWLDWPAELRTTYDLDSVPQELNWSGWSSSEPLDEGAVIPIDARLGKFIQAVDEEQIVSGAPPLPPLSVPAKEPPEPQDGQPAEESDQREGDPFAGLPDEP